ncbi:hypothetical protein P5775_32330 [Bacillus cereus]|uniref:hypothetical protein n=1 Tax=Bacillus cereus TaxID=1396 RepID=UPI002406A100|nr:hypothetical protein [Bacillus cereus]MDF9627310.1 hypothetical protein [Bacillus cereus]
MDKQNILSELKKGMEAVICEIELQEQSIVKKKECNRRSVSFEFPDFLFYFSIVT